MTDNLKICVLQCQPCHVTLARTRALFGAFALILLRNFTMLIMIHPTVEVEIYKIFCL